MPQLNLTLESPGVEIREIDLSINPDIPIGTTIYLVGFSPQGPSDEPTYISSLVEYEEIFGLPETPAERYAYHAAKQILTTSNGNLLFTRMPYGSGCGIGYANSYSTLVFPVVGVSAYEVDPCTYYTALVNTDVINSFPWLYKNYFVESSICIGSDKFECPQTPTAAATGLVIHNYPFAYDGVLSSIKWVADDDVSAESLTAVLLRPVVDSLDCQWSVISSIALTSFTVSDEGSELNITDGVATWNFSGSAFNVQDGDRIATYSEQPVFKFYSSTNGKSTIASDTLPTVGTILSAIGTGTGSNCLSGTLDYLVKFCYDPTDTGISCATVTALNLKVPEEDKWTFNPVPGDAQLDDANFYVLGQPIHVTLSDSEYQLLKNEQFNWKCGALSNNEALLDLANNDVRAGLIITNKAKTAQLEDFTGYYVAVNDNLTVNPATDFNEVTGVCGRFDETCLAISGAWTPVPAARLNFDVSAEFDGNAGSISEIIEQNAGLDFGDVTYNDSLIVSLFKLRPTRFTDSILKLDSILVEKFVGSLNSDRMIEDSFGGPPRTMYLEEVVNRGSNYLNVLVNPFISENNCWNNTSGIPQKRVRTFREKTGGVFANFDPADALQNYSDNLYGVGAYTGYCDTANNTRCTQKDIGSLPCKLERSLYCAENPLIYDIDISIDAGVSTIWSTRQAVASDACLTDTSICYHFDDTVFIDTNSLSPIDGNPISSDLQDGWEVVYNLYNNFAQRKADATYPGHLHIQDPVRQIFVNGADFKVVNRQKQTLLDPVTGNLSKRYSTFSRNIYTYLRNLYQSANSSYSTSYANWIKDYDKSRDKICWYPSSSYAAAAMARTDQNFFPWFAPMGATRGVVPNVLDLAINPAQKERDLLYRINLNPIVNFPGEGTLLWGQKTLLRTSSALDRINVRRLLLELEKATQRTLWQFIGEPNTIITRTRVENALNPIFSNAKSNQGLYDYLIIVDERNNGPSQIDQNALQVDIYLKPVKAIEFIKANFIVTRTGVDFGELL